MSGLSLVVGAGGGIGRALVEALVARGEEVRAWSRRSAEPPAGVASAEVDVTDERALAAAAAALGDAPVVRVIVATGLLHASGLAPERSLSELDAEALMRLYAANAVGPALVLKHLAPRLPRRGRSAVGVLSARVGSLGDNRLGGWYGYRASKAALNMLLRCAAIELARTRPDAVVAGLHPGTVDTPLSRPFQARVPSGALRGPAETADDLLRVLDGLAPADSGNVFAYDGVRVPD